MNRKGFVMDSWDLAASSGGQMTSNQAGISMHWGTHDLWPFTQVHWAVARVVGPEASPQTR